MLPQSVFVYMSDKSNLETLRKNGIGSSASGRTVEVTPVGREPDENECEVAVFSTLAQQADCQVFNLPIPPLHQATKVISDVYSTCIPISPRSAEGAAAFLQRMNPYEPPLAPEYAVKILEHHARDQHYLNFKITSGELIQESELSDDLIFNMEL